MPPRMAPNLRAAILEDLRAGGHTCRGLARKHGVSTASVRKVARDNGITDAFSREKTKKATEARQADHAAVLAELASRSAGIAGNIAASYEAMELDDWAQVSPYSRAIAFGIFADKARELAPDSDAAQAEAAKSVLAEVAAALIAKHGDGG
jgi:transposase-like protein